MVMAKRSDQQGGQISLGKQILLHLAPGVLATDLFVLLNSLLPVERVPYRNNLVLYSEPGLSDGILTESSILFMRAKSEAIE